MTQAIMDVDVASRSCRTCKRDVLDCTCIHNPICVHCREIQACTDDVCPVSPDGMHDWVELEP